MNIPFTLSAPLPWLTSIARLFSKNKYLSNISSSSFILPRTLSFTREGKRFIAILFIIGIAAINTGNNLLYLVVAMMLSFIIISGILSESAIRGIEISRTLPQHIFAGRLVTVKWNIVNQKRILPSFSLVIEEIPPFKSPLIKGGDRGVKGLKEGVKGEKEGFIAESDYIVKLPAHTSFSQRKTYTFHKRGLYKLKGFMIKTRFPFGFFMKGRRLLLSGEALVYPNIKPIKHTTTSIFFKSGEVRKRQKGQGFHLYSIRQYTLADDSRLIHWKSTAKTTHLMTKELEQEGNKRVKIIFYNTLIKSPQPPFDKGGKKVGVLDKVEKKIDLKNKFEDMVDEVASLTDYFIRSGFEVGFKSLNTELPCKSGREQLYRILRELAVIEPATNNANIPLGVRVAAQ